MPLTNPAFSPGPCRLMNGEYMIITIGPTAGTCIACMIAAFEHHPQTLV